MQALVLSLKILAPSMHGTKMEGSLSYLVSLVRNKLYVLTCEVMKRNVDFEMTAPPRTTQKDTTYAITLRMRTVIDIQRLFIASEDESCSGGRTRKTSQPLVSM